MSIEEVRNEGRDVTKVSNEEKILGLLTVIVDKIDNLEFKFDTLESKFDNIEFKVDGIEHKAEYVTKSQEKLEAEQIRLEEIEERLIKINDSSFKSILDSVAQAENRLMGMLKTHSQ